jgi:hypothetical protein
MKYTLPKVSSTAPTTDGAVATTLLAFVIKWLVGQYKDIVALYPVAKLTASKQYACFCEVMALFLIFDPVHNLKNLYNNFQMHNIFQCPTFDINLPNGCEASFTHIVQLYNHKTSFPSKKGHKLSSSALNPSRIEKTSVFL